MKIAAVKLLDSAGGSVLVRVLPFPCPPVMIEGKGRALVIRPGGIGDAVVVIPMLCALLDHGFNVDVLAERRNVGAFALCNGVREVFCYDSGSGLPRVLSRKYGLVVDTEQWHRLSAVVARLIPSSLKIGYGTNERRRMFTHAVPYSHHKYEAQSFLDLLKPLGIDVAFDPAKPFVSVPPEALCSVETLLPDGMAPVVLFPGASIAERRWGRERYGDLARRLAGRGLLPVVVGGAGDAADGDAIVAGTAGMNIAGKTTLAETAAVIARAQLVVSGDSGILHVAVALGVPTVSLFGPGIAAKWAPRGEKHVVINHNLPCSPCTKLRYTPRCPKGAPCISGITVDEVEAAVVGLLEKVGKKR